MEGPIQPGKLLGYAGVAAGFGIGYLLNGMFLKLSDRLAGLTGSIFSGTARSGAGPADKVSWKDWIPWLISVAIWAGVALWGFYRFKSGQTFGNGLLMGVGLGGVVEEIFHVPGGV